MDTRSKPGLAKMGGKAGGVQEKIKIALPFCRRPFATLLDYRRRWSCKQQQPVSTLTFQVLSGGGGNGGRGGGEEGRRGLFLIHKNSMPRSLVLVPPLWRALLQSSLAYRVCCSIFSQGACSSTKHVFLLTFPQQDIPPFQTAATVPTRALQI